jgi:probable F420-dependent oxidoreductase
LTGAPTLGRIGIWSSELRTAPLDHAAEAAAELEELGYGTIWLPGRGADDLEERVMTLLDATKSMCIATGIVSIWTHNARETAALHARVDAVHRNRFLLGIGVSHEPLVARTGLTYRKPLTAMKAYLDELDSAETPVRRAHRVLAALAPRMLLLARERAAGSHPYLVTPEHTRHARDLLGPEAILAPEQMVLLEDDPSRARSVARRVLALYLRLPNYVANLRRLGFDETDVADEGSDRLIDSLIALGAPSNVARRVDEHLAAGANHVCIQTLRREDDAIPRAAWQRLAATLLH